MRGWLARGRPAKIEQGRGGSRIVRVSSLIRLLSSMKEPPLERLSLRPLTIGSTVRQGSVQALGIHKPLGGVLFQAVQNDCFQVSRQVGSKLAQPPNRLVRHLKPPRWCMRPTSAAERPQPLRPRPSQLAQVDPIHRGRGFGPRRPSPARLPSPGARPCRPR
jgi:hypothetical protein